MSLSVGARTPVSLKRRASGEHGPRPDPGHELVGCLPHLEHLETGQVREVLGLYER